jgi:hypothetical protein
VTRQNRVLPTGEIVTAPFRGAFMGNRGILHDEGGRLGRARWRHAHWLICELHFKDRRRTVMAPGRYTELFFLDEAVALAAGHRPCAECRRSAFERFRSAWAAASGGDRPPAATMDRALHAARLQGREQRTIETRLAAVPEGAFVRRGSGPPALVWAGRLHAYADDRYGPGEPILPDEIATVLTPKPTLAVLAAGYRPAVALS